jgi:anti-anti-sigma factor
MKPSLTIDARIVNDVTLLRCRGAIQRGRSVELFSAAVQAQIRCGRTVALDLRGVTRMDARGTGALAELVAVARTLGRRLTLAGASPQVITLLALAGLDGELRPAEPLV